MNTERAITDQYSNNPPHHHFRRSICTHLPAVTQNRTTLILNHLHRAGNSTQNRTHLLVPLRLAHQTEEIVSIALKHVRVVQVAHLLQRLTGGVDIRNIHEEDLRAGVVGRVLRSLSHSLVTHSGRVATGIHEVETLGGSAAAAHQLAEKTLVLAATLQLETNHGLGRAAKHGVGDGMTPHGDRHTRLTTVLANSKEILVGEVGGDEEARGVGGIGVVALHVETQLRAGHEANTVVIQSSIVYSPSVELSLRNQLGSFWSIDEKKVWIGEWYSWFAICRIIRSINQSRCYSLAYLKANTSSLTEGMAALRRLPRN